MRHVAITSPLIYMNQNICYTFQNILNSTITISEKSLHFKFNFNHIKLTKSNLFKISFDQCSNCRACHNNNYLRNQYQTLSEQTYYYILKSNNANLNRKRMARKQNHLYIVNTSTSSNNALVYCIMYIQLTAT